MASTTKCCRWGVEFTSPESFRHYSERRGYYDCFGLSRPMQIIPGAGWIVLHASLDKDHFEWWSEPLEMFALVKGCNGDTEVFPWSDVGGYYGSPTENLNYVGCYPSSRTSAELDAAARAWWERWRERENSKAPAATTADAAHV